MADNEEDSDQYFNNSNNNPDADATRTQFHEAEPVIEQYVCVFVDGDLFKFMTI